MAFPTAGTARISSWWTSMNIIGQMFTDKDGIADDGRIAAFLLMLTYIGNSVYAVYLGQVWHPQDFGIGAGALVTGLGALLKLRGDN